jgi:RNA polymerase sigma-70 factor (ECF subfamily)
MTAFATLTPVYSTPIFGRSRSENLSTSPDAANVRALDQFLAGVERKAFKIAQLGLRNDDDALDAVQDAMMKLVQSYADRAADEWKPLFYRILGNCISDMQRRRTVRGRVMAFLPAFRGEDDDDEYDPIAAAPSHEATPARRLELDEAIGALEQAIQELPARQRQAFLLRNFEALDTAQTAAAMGCSEGSVKTHYFRALETLRARLGDVW